MNGDAELDFEDFLQEATQWYQYAEAGLLDNVREATLVKRAKRLFVEYCAARAAAAAQLGPPNNWKRSRNGLQRGSFRDPPRRHL